MFQISSTFRVACAALVVTLLGSTVPAQAGTFYSTGFEAPAFTPGLVVGQNGWENLLGNGNAVITTTNPSSGLQAVQIGGADMVDFGGFSYSLYQPDFSTFKVDSTVTPLVYFQVDVRLDGPSTSPDDLISGNATVYASNGNLLSELYVSSDGNIWADNGTTFQVAAIGGVGQYFTLGMLDNFSNLTSALYVNGSYVGSLAMPVPTSPFIQFDLQMADVTGSVDPTQYAATFDNYVVASVPEPSTVVMWSLLAGVFGVGGLRKRLKNNAIAA